eukprot:scaffold7045_cov126-Isochrysis_galbana.AAC.2
MPSCTMKRDGRRRNAQSWWWRAGRLAVRRRSAPVIGRGAACRECPQHTWLLVARVHHECLPSQPRRWGRCWEEFTCSPTATLVQRATAWLEERGGRAHADLRTPTL